MIEGSSLVLNRSWLAIHVTPVRRALSLLYMDHARVVHPRNLTLMDFEDWVEFSQAEPSDRCVHTPTMSIRLPEVVVLSFFNGYIRHEARFSRSSIFERDRSVCQYCGTHMPRSQLTIDHVMPVSRGGEDTWENLVVACLKCNVTKGNKTPEEAKMPLRRPPKQPAWIPAMAARVTDDQLAHWRRFVDPAHWQLQAAK